MNNMGDKLSIKEYIICNLILIASMICTFFAGVSEIFVFILIPSCLAYMFARFKAKYAFLPVLLTLAVPSVMTLSLELSILILSVPTAGMISFALNRKKGLLYTVSLGVIGEILSVAIIIAISYFSSQSPMAADTTFGQFSIALDTAMNSAMDVYQIPADQRSMLYEMFTALLPAMIVCTMAIISYVTLYICTAVLKKRDISYRGIYRHFSEIKSDRMCVLVTIVFFIISMFTDGVISKTLVNIVIILAFFMFVCGLSTLVFFVKKAKKRSVRIAVCILLAVTIFVTSSMFIFIGFIDAFIDVRKLNVKTDQQ